MKEFMTIFFISVVLVVAFYYALPRAFETDCSIQKEIASVGGCNRDGWCGVKYADGSFGQDHLPSVGETVCVQHTTRFRR